MRVILNLLIAAAIAYAAMLLLVFLFQPRLVYFPQIEREFSITPRASGLDYEDADFKSEDGVRLHGWWVPARAARGAVLLMHGNAGNIANRLAYLTMFNRLGYSVLLFDYRGYGKSGGRPDEEGTYRDADAAYRHLTEVRNVKPYDIVLLGESLGGGVATWLALKHPPRALILASTFTSIPDLGAKIYPWLPVRLLARVKYDNLSRIGKIEAPVLIAHSKSDDIVPFAHGQALFDAAREPKQMLVLAGGHNEGFLFARDDWVAAVGAFLGRSAKKMP
ncbi:MAG: alpha/beta hydrolase fold containing protein [Betaproteobacteria bacterium]|nr:alpha/beta hydrolase fold containing protein [Betaproteobacteria bacterium]